MEGKKKRLFGSNIFGGRRENKNTAEGPWRVKLSVPAQRSRGEGHGAPSQASGLNGVGKAKEGKEKGGDYQLTAGLFK